jgi:hypothetical protein
MTNKKTKYICENCEHCLNWDYIFQCCAEANENSNVDMWQLCNKNRLYRMSRENYYDIIIRDNTRYYISSCMEEDSF